jgi:hypothetical protein
MRNPDRSCLPIPFEDPVDRNHEEEAEPDQRRQTMNESVLIQPAALRTVSTKDPEVPDMALIADPAYADERANSTSASREEEMRFQTVAPSTPASLYN